MNRTAFDGRVIFDHLPKTAGQAVNAWLVKSLGNGCVTPNLIGDHRDLIRRYGGDYSVISAHVHFAGSCLDPRYSYMTCFREPLDRAVSWLFFVLKNHDQSQLENFWDMADRFFVSNGQDLDEGFRSSISNCYVEHFVATSSSEIVGDEAKVAYALQVVENYDVWGLYEQMPEFLADVAALIGLPAPQTLERVNVTKERLGVSQINDQLRARLEALNSLDLQFYAELKRRYDQKMSSRTMGNTHGVSNWVPYEPVSLFDREFLGTGVELIAFNSSIQDVVKKGEIVSVQIDLSLPDFVNELEIGIHVFDSEKRWAFGVNSSMLSKVMRNHPAGVHRFSYYFVADMPDGDYTVGFAAAEKAGGQPKELAWFDRLADLRVKSNRLSPGVGYLDIPVDFSAQPLSETPAVALVNTKGMLFPKAMLGACVASQSFRCVVDVLNDSDQAWSGLWRHPIYLSYRWLDAQGNVVVADGARTPLPKTQILPGESVLVEVSVIAPENPGEYRLMVLPVQEHVCWFDEHGFTPLFLDVSVKKPGEAISFADAYCAFYSQVGRRSLNALVSTGVAGCLFHGPYLVYPVGNYRAKVFGLSEVGANAWVDVVADGGGVTLARKQLVDRNNGECIAEICFSLEQQINDLEIRLWVEALDRVSVDRVSIEPIDSAALKPEAPVFGEAEMARINMTASCDDCADVPKVDGAGSVSVSDGQLVQLMHDGTRVVAGGYFGAWMQEVIQRLRGHHEPQEERLFHALLQYVRPASLMVELGCFWAYYSNWFVGAVPQGRALCIEPDEIRLGVGMQNFKLNNREATFAVAAAGGQFEQASSFIRESDGKNVKIPFWDFGKVLEQVGGDNIELLHMDAQGAELPFLKSIESTDFRGRVRFVVISTHHKSISGSATTHRDCLATLIDMGAFILCEHSVDESFSGDGLIVASFLAEDTNLVMPSISRNRPEDSLFGPDPCREVLCNGGGGGRMDTPRSLEVMARATEWVNANDGPMCVFTSDSIIGAALRTEGAFGTEKIDEVVEFLKSQYGFFPRSFIDIGANIGTHLIHAIKSGLFENGLAFEPDPNNYALLSKNIVANELQGRVRAFKLALSSSSGVATFELCSENFGDHRVRVADFKGDIDLGENQRQLISVLKDTGDAIFSEHGLSLDDQTLIWVDTQGHEGYVFEGFRRLLSSGKKKFIVCEFWPYGLERANGKVRFLNFVDQCSHVYDVNQHGWGESKSLDRSDLESMYARMLDETRLGHYPHTDLLCVLG